MSDPLAVTVQGVATVNNAENVKAIERQIAEIETSARDATPGTPTPVQLVRARAR